MVAKIRATESLLFRRVDIAHLPLIKKVQDVSYGEEPLETKPICFKGRKGQLEKLRTVPKWQERLRDFVDQLISELPKEG